MKIMQELVIEHAHFDEIDAEHDMASSKYDTNTFLNIDTALKANQPSSFKSIDFEREAIKTPAHFYNENSQIDISEPNGISTNKFNIESKGFNEGKLFAFLD
jgi:hypothetical protein